MRAESKRSTLPPGNQRRLGSSSGLCGRRGDYYLNFVVVAVGGDAGGWSNHADNQNVRLLPKNPIGFDGDDPAGRRHVRVCIVSACEPAAARCVQRVLACRVVGQAEPLARASTVENKQGEISPQSDSLIEMPRCFTPRFFPPCVKNVFTGIRHQARTLWLSHLIGWWSLWFCARPPSLNLACSCGCSLAIACPGANALVHGSVPY